MKGTMALLKVAVNNNFGWSWMRETYLRRKQRLWEPLLLLFGILVSAPGLTYVYVKVLNIFYDQGAVLHQPQIILTLAILAAQFIMLLFGFFWLISVFYFSNDLPRLVPLPLTPQAVLGSKFLQVMMNELLTVLIFVGPAVAVYGVRSGAGIGYWIVALLTAFLLPVIPLAIAGVLTVLLMRVINVRRSRDLLTVIAGIIGLAVFIVIQYLTARMPDGREAEYLSKLLSTQNGVIEALGRRFPPSIWATNAMAHYHTAAGLAQFAVYLVVSLALLATMLLAAKILFYDGLLAGGVSARKVRLTATEIQSVQARGAIPAIIKREWLTLRRTPVFVLQWLVSALIFPIMLGVLYMTKSSNIPIGEIAKLPVHWLALAGAGMIAFGGTMMQLAPTIISREGSNFWLTKVIPVSPVDQLRAKQVQIWEATLLASLPTFAVLGYIGGFKMGTLIPMVILGILGLYPLINLGLLLDLLWPKLHWTNPQQAMKGNLNVLASMAFGLIILGGCVFMVIKCFQAGWTALLVYAALGLLLAVLGYLLDEAVRRVGTKRLRGIEM